MPGDGEATWALGVEKHPVPPSADTRRDHNHGAEIDLLAVVVLVERRDDLLARGWWQPQGGP